jgi:ribosomal 30S subunit maturation factor RimM
LVVVTPAGEALIPLVLDICTTIDTAGRRIVIDPPEGLLALNQKS